MILTGPEIHHRVKTKEIDIDPFDPGQLSPNSYDVHLGTRIGWYTHEHLDCARDNPFEHHTIPDGGLVLSRDGSTWRPPRNASAATRSCRSSGPAPRWPDWACSCTSQPT